MITDTDTKWSIEIKKTSTPQLDGQLKKKELKFGRTFSDHMFVARYENGKWETPRIKPFENISLSPASSLIHYGQSIFEGLKAFRTPKEEILVFRPEENWKRLNLSAERMCMPMLPKSYFIEGLKELLNLDRAWVPSGPTSSLYIRPFMFATDEFLGVKPSETYQFMIITSPSGSYYNEPVKVKIETTYSRAAAGGVGSAKTAGNYAASLYPAKLAQEEGFHQLIWTDSKEHRYIEESGTMNLMCVIDGTLMTPPLSKTILPGITRNSVLTLAKEWGIPVEERRISVDELREAYQNGKLEEAFGVGTAATVAHIHSIGYQGENWILPPVEDRKVSNRLLQFLTRLQRGQEEDKFGWNLRV